MHNDDSNNYLVGVDVGSSGVKTILLDTENGIIAKWTAEVDQFSDFPGWSEADTNQWWNGFKKGISEVLRTSNISANQIKGVAFSGMVPALVCIDKFGNPIRRAILQNDARAVDQIINLKAKLNGIDVLKITGSVISQQWIAPTIQWLYENEKSNYSQVRTILGSYDWMAIKLGAQLHVEYNWAIESGLFKLNGDIFEDLKSQIGIQWPEIPQIKKSGEYVGEVSNTAALEVGLAVGTPIFVGGADHVLSAFGAGLSKEGDALLKLGGAGDILAVSNQILLDERLYLDAHPAPDKWLPNGCMATSGSILRWEQKLLSQNSLEKLDLLAESEKPGTLLTLPYFLGEKTPLHDPNLRGSIIGLHLGTTTGEFHRSFLEAIAYGFKHHMEVFRSLDLQIIKPKVTNGGSKSRLWRQILSDVLNVELESIIDHPGAAYGAAICAGIGSGVIKDWTYVENKLQIEETISPNPANHEIYEERFAQFLQISSQLSEISHNLAKGQKA